MLKTTFFRRPVVLLIAVTLLASPHLLHAYTVCTVTVTAHGDGGSDCSTRCNFYDDNDHKYKGYVEYGWC